MLSTEALEAVNAIIGEYHDTHDPSDRERFFERLSRAFTLKPSSSTNFAGAQRPPE